MFTFPKHKEIIAYEILRMSEATVNALPESDLLEMLKAKVAENELAESRKR